MLKYNKNDYLSEDSYDLVCDPKHATLFTTGNGYMGVRGSYEEYGSARIQGAYIRGLFDEIVEVMEPFPDNSYMKKYYFDEDSLKNFEVQDSCINFADILLIRFKIGNHIFYPWEGKILSWQRYLDIDKAALIRVVEWEDDNKNITRFEFERFASYKDEHLYVMKATAIAVNHEQPITVLSGIDKRVRTGGQRIVLQKQQDLQNDMLIYCLTAGKKYGFEVGICSVSRFFEQGREIKSVKAEEKDGQIYTYASGKGEISVEKVVHISTSRDHTNDVYSVARENATRYLNYRYNTFQNEHLSVWQSLLMHFDVQIEGDKNANNSLRFSTYHTIISAALNDSIHSLSAKTLSGEKYNQFVWWDSEIYQLPIFIHAKPEIARNCLIYRYNQLSDAKKNAEKGGLAGARYPFVASIGGEEKIWKYARHPHLQVHITADVGFGVIKYYENTLDSEFMQQYGKEMLAEISKYWCSRVVEKNGRYEILDVTGTDEHHPYVHNDAYTNYIVKLVLDRTLQYCKAEEKHLSIEGKAKIQDVIDRLYLPMHENGMIAQFDGYFSLSRSLEVSGSGTGKSFQMKQAGLYHLSQVIKQPDVMLLFSYINYPLKRESYAQNWDYYENMCESSSSLSYPVHAICSIDNNRMLSFYNYFMETVRMDIDDIHNCAWQGIHAGCAAGGYYAILRGVFGCIATEDVLKFHPNSVPFWDSVSIRFMYHGAEVKCRISEKKLTIETDKKIPLSVFGEIEEVIGKKEYFLEKK